MRFLAAVLAAALLTFLCAIPAGASFESEYKSYRGEWAGGGRSPIKMKLVEDTITFVYSPVFYFDSGFHLTEQGKAAIIDECLAGFRQWEGIYEIGGRELTVVVDVHPATSASKLGSNVRILPLNPILTSMVWGTSFWKPSSPFLRMELRNSSPQYLTRVAMHEFGHILGLSDAYGYGQHFRRVIPFLDLGWLGDWLLPEAPPDRAPEDGVMRGGWDITPTDIEMLLWAWKNNRFQLYVKSISTWVGGQVSPVFSK